MTDVVKVVDVSDNPRNYYKEVFYAIAFLSIVVSISTFFYWFHYPQELYTINNNTNETGESCIPDRSHDGDGSFYRGCGIPVRVTEDYIFYKADFCGEANTKGTVTTIVVNRDTNQEAIRSQAPIQFDKEVCVHTDAVIPKPSLPEGTYYIRFIVSAEVNPIRTLRKETQTLSWTEPLPKD